MNAERRPEAPHDHYITLDDDRTRVTDRPVSSRADHRQRRARERVQTIERRRRIARMADELMPMARYYGPQPLLAVPIGHYYVRGRWAA